MIILFPLFFSCEINNEKIEKLNWKYGDGYHIGDMINFKNIYKLQGDTIFNRQNPIGLKLSCKKRIDGTEIMKIKSFSSAQTGTYYAK